MFIYHEEAQYEKQSKQTRKPTKTKERDVDPRRRSFSIGFLINSLLSDYMVGRVGVEPTFSDFQSGAPTVYATDPNIFFY